MNRTGIPYREKIGSSEGDDMAKVAVFGSYIMDLTCLSPHIPVTGETVLAGPFTPGPGGKGFNQAVAARRTGTEVSFMTKIGKDIFNQFAKGAFTRFGIPADYLLEAAGSQTGIALIIVDKSTGANVIAVSPEACNELTAEEVRENSSLFNGADVFLTQFESNIQATEEAIRIAHEKGLKVILNPAPIQGHSEEIFRFVDYLIPNEIEAEELTGIRIADTETAAKASEKLERLVKTVILTLGDKGVYCSAVSEEIIPICKVDTVDTTGAGDAFAGIFASYLARGCELKEAIYRALTGAALSTTRFGTSPSMPAEAEIETLYKERFGVI